MSLSEFLTSLDPKLLGISFTLVLTAELSGPALRGTAQTAKRYFSSGVFAGAFVGLALNAIIAVVLGSVAAHFPRQSIHLAAAFLFLAFAWIQFHKSRSRTDSRLDYVPHVRKLAFLRSVIVAFLVLFRLEWGELGQGTILLLAATERQPLTIMTGSLLAYAVIVSLAILLRDVIEEAFPKKPILLFSSAYYGSIALILLRQLSF